MCMSLRTIMMSTSRTISAHMYSTVFSWPNLAAFLYLGNGGGFRLIGSADAQPLVMRRGPVLNSWVCNTTHSLPPHARLYISWYSCLDTGMVLTSDPGLLYHICASTLLCYIDASITPTHATSSRNIPQTLRYRLFRTSQRTLLLRNLVIHGVHTSVSAMQAVAYVHRGTQRPLAPRRYSCVLRAGNLVDSCYLIIITSPLGSAQPHPKHL